jgi:long-subunit acyl-CoA synthetase (AMP-forming)
MDMKNLLDSLPANPVLLSNGQRTLDRAALALRVECVVAALQVRQAPRAAVAILADNDPEWLVVDLATQALGVTLVPLPLFFTPEQWLHVLRSSGAQALFCADPGLAALLGFVKPATCDSPFGLYEQPFAATLPLLDDVQKITFTSGTTATPKGVCLGTEQQWDLARTLQAALAPLQLERHLCLLPFAVLLENIAGPYTALLSGATTFCPPLIETGLSGASGFDPHVCLDAIARYAPHSIILVPQMLQALVAAAAPDDARLASLRFVAVGGGKTAPALLAAARARGLPVYEGYGLSECASVVALNLPGAERAGSVGRPLANRAVRIAPDGEILVGATVVRYLDAAPAGDDVLATGDLGHLDADGFLYVDGRKKDILITGFGRNISPEWPEAALTATGVIAQAMVVGEAQAHLAALIVPARAGLDAATLAAAVDRANATLPDYARIRRWVAVAPFTPANGMATANGRPRRALIHAQFAARIAALFDPQESIP